MKMAESTGMLAFFEEENLLDLKVVRTGMISIIYGFIKFVETNATETILLIIEMNMLLICVSSKSFKSLLFLC
jgi:hypothetical protein